MKLEKIEKKKEEMKEKEIEILKKEEFSWIGSLNFKNNN